MHFTAFTCKEWKPNSVGRYGINSSASKACFVTAMFADMLSLIIQNRFHLLVKYFSIQIHWVMFPLLRCLLILSPSLLLAPLNKNFKSAFSLQRIFLCEIFPCEYWQFSVVVFAVLFPWEIAWDSTIVNIVLQTMKRQLFVNTLGSDGIRNRFQSNVA